MSLISTLAQVTSDFTFENDTTTSGTEAASMLFVLLFMLVIVAVFYVLLSICFMKIFEKAGRKDTWAAWVPFYNQWVLYEIAGRPGWWVLVGLIPFVGGIIALVLNIIAMIDLSKSFDKGGGFAALLVLLPIIGFPMLAFGDDKYLGAAGPEGNKTPPSTTPNTPTTPSAQV